MTQCEMILEWMKKGGCISSFEAFTGLGCTRLAARIYDLKAQGHLIGSIRAVKTNRFGAKVSFDVYYPENYRYCNICREYTACLYLFGETKCCTCGLKTGEFGIKFGMTAKETARKKASLLAESET